MAINLRTIYFITCQSFRSDSAGGSVHQESQARIDTGCTGTETRPSTRILYARGSQTVSSLATSKLGGYKQRRWRWDERQCAWRPRLSTGHGESQELGLFFQEAAAIANTSTAT